LATKQNGCRNYVIDPFDAFLGETQGKWGNQPGPRQLIVPTTRLPGLWSPSHVIVLTLRRTGFSPPIYSDQLDYEVIEDGRAIGRMYENCRAGSTCTGSPSI
jgi:hypothetical protein